MVEDLSEDEIAALKRLFKGKAWGAFEKSLVEEVTEGKEGLALADVSTEEGLRRHVRKQGEIVGMEAVLSMVQEVRDYAREE